jgi:hypothetical protein
VSADVVMLDEAGFVEDGMYYDFLFPLWGVDRTVAILVTTPPKHYSPFLDLIYKIHPKTGDKLVLDYVVNMVCNRCQKNRIRKDNCKHQIRKYLPDDKSAEKMDIAAIFYRDRMSYNREFLYVIKKIENPTN